MAGGVGTVVREFLGPEARIRAAEEKVRAAQALDGTTDKIEQESAAEEFRESESLERTLEHCDEYCFECLEMVDRRNSAAFFRAGRGPVAERLAPFPAARHGRGGAYVAESYSNHSEQPPRHNIAALPCRVSKQ